MATTVPDGIWSPDDSTAYNPPVDLAAMADTVQAGLNSVRDEVASRPGQPLSMASGVVSPRSVAANAAVSVAVTFPPGRFTVPPIVTLGNLGGARDTVVGFTSLTAAGMSVELGSLSVVTRTFGAHWTAVQMTASSGAG